MLRLKVLLPCTKFAVNMQKFPGPQFSEYLLLHFPYLFLFYFYWNAWKMSGLDEEEKGRREKRGRTHVTSLHAHFSFFFFCLFFISQCLWLFIQTIKPPLFFSMIGYYDTFWPFVFLMLPFLFAVMPLRWWNKWSISLTSDLHFYHKIFQDLPLQSSLTMVDIPLVNFSPETSIIVNFSLGNFWLVR